MSCSHRWIPIEWIAGKRIFENDTVYKSWTSNIFNAHYLRVTKLYCPECGSQREVPSDAKDE